ncbi:hypothetical protein Vadar_000110 [Vaccinium darrowii]|uniref:Uncharacterized protein n=1 Tax=Vaccinium darrowii TaxID=229202 RepID=A0ACB7Z8I1_9ERIC|nr:hypothetical protein Vadar_000110 [Vaccinium darrowii]
MDPRAVYPACVLKVNLGCCQACVVNLKKLLSTIDGVYGFDINVVKGLVTVSGTAHPQLLVEKIRQKKKKAVLVSYEKPTPNAKTDDSNGKENKKDGNFSDSNTKENKKNGNFLDSNTKENKKHGNGDQKGKKKDYLCHHEPDSHEFEAHVAPKPSPIDTCRDPYCKIHHKKPVIIRPTDNTPTNKFQLPLNRPHFLPPHLPPPGFLPRPPPVPHYPRIEPIAYDRPLPQYDPWYHQRPPPQSDPWSNQRPPPPLPPHYGYHGARHAYTGH